MDPSTDPSAAPNIVWSLVRSTLITLGGVLVAKGYYSAETNAQVVGAIMVILPALAGAWSHYKANEKLKAAIAAPVGKATV